jgi:hypothetical protein
MVLSATFNNISAIIESVIIQSVLLVEETRGPGDSFQAIMSGNSLHIRLVLYISSHLCFIFKERILTDKSYN